MPALRFLHGLLFLMAAAAPLHAETPEIKPQGMLIRDCTLPGDTRKDDVVPRHANAIQLAADRWLVIYSTHGYRGVDDERSIVYQIRKDRPDGPVIKEDFLARTDNDWRPAGVPAPPEGKSYVKQHGHMVAFGVPRGAMIDCQIPAHANTFVICWRVLGRPLVLAENRLEKAYGSELFLKTRAVEWRQVRLNEAGDDLVVVQPTRILRQKGHETGELFCAAKDAGWMNQSFCPPVPVNAAKTEWAVANHFDNSRVAAIKFRFNESSGLYEWVEIGPFIGGKETPCMEASLIHAPTGWVVANRSAGKVAWARSDDPFKGWSKLTMSSEPAVNAPLTAHLCADGVIRLFTGDKAASPQKYDRDPLYCWEVTPGEEFVASRRQTIFDSREAKLPIRPEVRSKVDFCELFPLHDRTQLTVFGVSTRGYNFPYEGVKGIPKLRQEEKDAAGIYYATLTYPSPVPPTWTFQKAQR